MVCRGHRWFLAALASAICVAAVVVASASASEAPAASQIRLVPAPQASEADMQAAAEREQQLPRPALRIVGGSATTIEQWPWQVLTVWDDSVVHGDGYQRRWCGGSLVAPTIVITAAHCVFNIPGTPPGWLPAQWLEAVTGRTIASSGQGQLMEIANIYHFVDSSGHQLYNPSTFEWDVALLQLASPSSSPTIQIAGADEGATWAGGRTAYATGWGDTSGASTAGSDNLLVTPLPMGSDATCAQVWRAQFAAALMTCAGGAGHSGCHGDSGGPLVVPVEIGSALGFRLIGDTSFGDQHCDPAVPAVYAGLARDPIRPAVQQAVQELTGVNIVGSGARPLEPPDTAITRGPRTRVRSHKRRLRVRLEFTASEPASLQCRFDGGSFTPCTSPLNLKVRRGKHRFAVQAVDALGAADASPASVRWKVVRGRR
jgi:hypothetical protein